MIPVCHLRMEQIIEKETQKKKEDEDTRKILQERDEALRRQIKIEEERLREKELQMKVHINVKLNYYEGEH